MSKKESLIGPKKPSKVGIKLRTFGFIDVKYKCPRVAMFLGPYEGLFFDNNKLFLFFKIIYYGQFIALSKKFFETTFVTTRYVTLGNGVPILKIKAHFGISIKIAFGLLHYF